mmetsp:Transcript_109386/g.244426  ORF Transcript_109386/g.244426 Transcript_109386/m.244426 type:complete len:268 (-) Transcript_109386:34-837(-)
MAGAGSCCPPGSLPYLVAGEQGKGAEVSAGTVHFYATGDAGATVAVVIASDVWGWSSGRVRAIADYVASSLGAYVLVPKLLDQPALEGGCNGDGLPPDFSIETRQTDFMKWIKKHSWSSLQARVEAVFAHLEGKKVGMVGFCWGGWLLCHASALSKSVLCGVIAHPSVGLEQLFGGSPATLASTVQCPILFMPAGNDPPIYAPGGDVFDAVKAKHAATATIAFPEMQHGWVARGDSNDDKVKRDIEEAVSTMTEYLATNLGVVRSRL